MHKENDGDTAYQELVDLLTEHKVSPDIVPMLACEILAAMAMRMMDSYYEGVRDGKLDQQFGTEP